MRVLILTTDAGGGHRSAARALAAAFVEVGGADCHVDVVDFLVGYAPFPLCHPRELYSFFTRYPALYDLFYEVTNTRRGRTVDAPAVGLFMEAGMRRLLHEHAPDVVVATHPMGAPALTSVLRRRRQSLPYYTAVTDYGALHIWWAFPFGEAWFAPSQKTASELISAGVPARRVIVSGYPVHPRFAQPPAAREEVRRGLGLDPDRFTALLVGGAEGVGPLQEVVEALASSPAPWQLVVVCGRNEALRERLAGQAEGWAVPVRIEGHVDDMPARMHAADLLLTKAGGSTLSEGLACGLPMLLINVLPGQEEGNARHFVSLGVAQCLAAVGEARAILTRLATPGSAELEAMAARARAAARPEASREIARQVLERGKAATATPIPPLFGVRLLRSRARPR